MTSLDLRLSLIQCLGAILLAGSGLPLLAQNGDRDGHVMTPPPAHWVIPPAPVVPADQARATFTIESGFELELVASDPMVQDPVALAFDGNGRIWVAEMKGYMPDIDAKLEASTYGRISILEDTNNDGVADKHTVFLEDYLLPRSLALINGDKGLLFADNEQLYEAEILTGADGTIKAGAVTVVDDSYAAGGNPEHKPNGLLQALDNWIYNAKSDTRYRKINGAWVKEKTEERGQWGIAQDNYGRLLSNTNSNLISVEEISPGIKLRNPEYQFRTKTDRTMADQSLWPSRITPGVNRGYMAGTLSEDGFLLKPTAASGFAIYRGDQFPSKYADQIFITEPAGNLVKRAVVTTNAEGFRVIESGTQGSEFLTSTDERARLVNAYNAPDGTLYFVDLYRGIIQHQVYMTSYLRAQVVERGLDKHIALGRIWRVRHAEGQANAEVPRLSDASSEDLVAALSRPSGWWRDTAQRLLVERGDQAAVPALLKTVAEGSSAYGRIHALWTLEGLGAFTSEVLQTALADPSPHVVAQAIRCAETLANTEQKDAVFSLLSARAQESDASSDFTLRRQFATSLGLFGDQALPLLVALVNGAENDPITGDLLVSGIRGHEQEFLAQLQPSDKLRLALIETIVRRKDQTAIASLLPELHSPAEWETLARMAVSQRVTVPARLLVSRAAQADTDAAERKAIVKGLISGGKDKKFKPMPVKDLPEIDALAAAKVNAGEIKSLAALFEIGSGEEKNFLVTAELQKQFKDGETHYQRICLGCHQIHGNGQTYLAPPLVGAEWVLGPPDRLIALVMDGVTGPIEVLGKTYTVPEIQPLMPGLRYNPEFTDEQLAAILTYVRNAWGNAATPVSEAALKEYRERVPARGPYTPEELLALPVK